MDANVKRVWDVDRRWSSESLLGKQKFEELRRHFDTLPYEFNSPEKVTVKRQSQELFNPVANCSDIKEKEENQVGNPAVLSIQDEIKEVYMEEPNVSSLPASEPDSSSLTKTTTTNPLSLVKTQHLAMMKTKDRPSASPRKETLLTEAPKKAADLSSTKLKSRRIVRRFCVQRRGKRRLVVQAAESKQKILLENKYKVAFAEYCHELENFKHYSAKFLSLKPGITHALDNKEILEQKKSDFVLEQADYNKSYDNRSSNCSNASGVKSKLDIVSSVMKRLRIISGKDKNSEESLGNPVVCGETQAVRETLTTLQHCVKSLEAFEARLKRVLDKHESRMNLALESKTTGKDEKRWSCVGNVTPNFNTKRPNYPRIRGWIPREREPISKEELVKMCEKLAQEAKEDSKKKQKKRWRPFFSILSLK